MAKFKTLKFAQKLGLISFLIIGISLIFLVWYKQTNSMGTDKLQGLTDPSLNRQLLIATQESPFKDLVTKGVSNHYKSVPVVVKVIDIAALQNTDFSNFDAILIVHRWEAGAPPETVQFFMENNSGLKDRVVVLTTSWGGAGKNGKCGCYNGCLRFRGCPDFYAKNH